MTVSSITTKSIFSGRGMPLRGNDIDTDRIIPARYMRCVTFDGLGENVFVDARAQAEGKHPFDLAQHQGSEVLIVNRNFGCGSSREHAPQALNRWGIKAIIGESFAEIFFGNCLVLGIPCVIANEELAKKLQTFAETKPDKEISVDIEKLAVSFDGASASINMDESARQMILSGTWDSCGQLLSKKDEIQKTATALPYMQWM